MNNGRDNPYEWGLLLYELEDAREHLESLIKDMKDAQAIDDEDFAIQLGHVFAHLNRAWHTRATVGDWPEDKWDEYSSFPADLKPVG